MSLWSRIKSRFSFASSADPQIRLLEDGFELVSANGVASVSVIWARVTRIEAYKLDLLTTDCICLLLEMDSGRTSVQVSEEWPGFQDLLGALTVQFPQVPESWYVDIAMPPFEPKRTLLFKAASGDSAPTSDTSPAQPPEG